jgi:hypothetical protein
VFARERSQLTYRPLESGCLREAAAFESEDRHGDLPACARLADHVTVVDCCAREEDLAKLAASGHLADAPHLDARLAHVDEEETDAAVCFGL